MRWAVVVLVMLGFAAEAGGGPAARPAPASPTPAPAVSPAWAGVVEQLTRALVESDPEALASLLADTVVIQSFEHRSSDSLRFLGRTRRATLLSCRTYAHPGLTIASDVAEDVRTARIPEEIRRRLGLRDDAHAKRANSIAYHWVAGALDAKTGDSVTVMVLWRERSEEEARAEGGRSELLWVLLKADAAAESPAAEAPADDTESAARTAGPRIKHIVFGDPQRTAR